MFFDKLKNNMFWRKQRQRLIKSGYTEKAVDKAINDYRRSDDPEYCRQQIQIAADYRALNNPPRNHIIPQAERNWEGYVQWRYDGKMYELKGVKFTRRIHSRARDMFCLVDEDDNIYTFYDPYGNKIFTYKYGEDIVFPDELGKDEIKFQFCNRKAEMCWWIYNGCKYCINNISEKARWGVTADRQFIHIAYVNYIGHSKRIHEKFYNPLGTLEYEWRTGENKLFLHSGEIAFEQKIQMIDYLYYDRLFALAVGDELVKDILIYDTSGEYRTKIPMPDGMYAVYCIAWRVGSDKVRIGYYAEKPTEAPDYTMNDLDRACENYAKLLLEWYDLDFIDGEPVLSINPTAADEFYYGYYRA